MIDLGDLHPSGHGAFRLRLTVDDDDRIVTAEPIPGLLHRGAEKLMEVRDYRQALMLANRHDWLSAVTSEVALALAVEDLLGLHVPERATWLRTLMCEVSRVAASLAHLVGSASMPGGSGARLPPVREAWLDLLEAVSGGRIHAMITRIGGLAADLPEGWLDHLTDAVEFTRRELPVLRDAALSAVVGTGVGVLTLADARRYAVSGPVARASGLDLDLRRDHPALAYADLREAIEVATATDGDAAARTQVLADQVLADLRLIEACRDRLPGGPVSVPLPKVLRVPEGASYAAVESATGITGAFIVSRGDPTPWRVRLRTASFANVQAMGAALPGTRLSDLAAAVGSFSFVAGDLDR